MKLIEGRLGMDDTPIRPERISPFERIKQTNEEGMEYWSARDLQRILEYADFRNFETVIDKAIIACNNSAQPAENHFVRITEMVDIGSSAKRPVRNYFFRKQELFEQATEDDRRLILPALYFSLANHPCPPFGHYTKIPKQNPPASPGEFFCLSVVDENDDEFEFE